ncbi:hypothetical protein [Neptuniibacter sp. QD37_11]|uniref:hypothetical protein n=1 Tax=Neptuniibacter sp. QD37_11 TaxID=3398209 RepID=UPI0039F5D374
MHYTSATIHAKVKHIPENVDLTLTIAQLEECGLIDFAGSYEDGDGGISVFIVDRPGDLDLAQQVRHILYQLQPYDLVAHEAFFHERNRPKNIPDFDRWSMKN